MVEKTALSSKYQPYPEYKDSGIEWLDIIPAQWILSKTKYLAPFQVGWTPPTKNKSNFEGDNLWANISDLKGQFLYETNNRISDVAAKNASMEISPKGSLLYSFKLSVGAVSFAGKDMYTNEAIASFLDGGKLPLSYLYYSLPLFIIENASTNIYGARILNQELIKGAFLLAPSYPEAEKIANFLDHETAKIDTLIEKQQQLIKLLKEKRQAVISHAVTKGLNPKAPMRDSGVEWLGEVPEHWRTGKLGYFTKISNGATPSRDNQKYWNNGTIGWLNSSKVNDVHITFAEQFITPLAARETSVQPVKNNDLVIAITGEGQTRGRVAICKITATINQHLAAITIIDRSLNYEYLFYWLTSQYERIRFESTGAGSTKGAITRSDIVSYPLPIPPANEQNEIVVKLDKLIDKYRKIEEKANTTILLMQERRIALISASVTGKIDLRNWQAPTTTHS